MLGSKDLIVCPGISVAAWKKSEYFPVSKPSSKRIAAAVAFALMSGGAGSAWAAGLGRLTVQSALGQPLRAEVEVTALSREEAASLNARLAPPDAFRQAGLEFNAALSSLRFAIDRRNYGRTFVRISSIQPINEPFVDIFWLNPNWATGKFVREYTFLLDPPELRQGREVVEGGNVQQAPVVAPAVASVRPTPGAQPAPAASEAPASTPAPSAASPTAPAARASRPEPAAQAGGAGPACTACRGRFGQGGCCCAGRHLIQGRPGRRCSRQDAGIHCPGPPGRYAGGRCVAQSSPGRVARPGHGVHLRGESVRVLRKRESAARRRFAQHPRPVDDVGGRCGQGARTDSCPERRFQRLPRAPRRQCTARRCSARGPVRGRRHRREGRGQGRRRSAERPAQAFALGAAPGSAAAAATGSAASRGAAAAENDVARSAALREAQSRVGELEKNVADLQRLVELKNKQLADLQKQVEDAAKAGKSSAGAIAKPDAPPAASAAPVASAPAVAASPAAPVAAVPAAPAPAAVAEAPKGRTHAGCRADRDSEGRGARCGRRSAEGRGTRGSTQGRSGQTG